MQAATQVGNVIALTIQAGLLTVHPDGVRNFTNIETSFGFMAGWAGILIPVFWIFYRRQNATPKAQ